VAGERGSKIEWKKKKKTCESHDAYNKDSKRCVSCSDRGKKTLATLALSLNKFRHGEGQDRSLLRFDQQMTFGDPSALPGVLEIRIRRPPLTYSWRMVL